MVERRRSRRKPLVLSSTRLLVDSLLNSAKETIDADAVEELPGQNFQICGNARGSLQFKAGILRCPKLPNGDRDSANEGLVSLDDSSLVGLSAAALKRLSITSGSLVLVTNVAAKLGRIGRVVVLDRPDLVSGKLSSEMNTCSSDSGCSRVVFPFITFPTNQHPPLDDTAHLSPLLAFNLGLHISSLKSLLHEGEETLMSFFEVKKDGADKKGSSSIEAAVSLELSPSPYLPRFASHMRAAFVKMPECGTIDSLKGSSSIESEDRQGMIDLALQNYFKVDRCLARGDLFYIQINWKCKSQMCIPCSQRMHESLADTIIYFKVMAMEPLDEPFLRVNCSQTALILGGSEPSAILPDLLLGGSKEFGPVQQETVEILSSVLVRAFCPTALSSRGKASVLLSGIPGCGRRTVVRYVAHRLGLHVVEFSCYDLIVSSANNASTALAQAFNTARRYSPAIVLLRHFEVFKSFSSHEGSLSDQVGGATEVASVLRKFTKPISENEVSDFGEDPLASFGKKDAERTYCHQLLLVAVADSSEGLPSSIIRCFSNEISMGPLSEEQRMELLSQSLQSVYTWSSFEASSLCIMFVVGLANLVKDIVGQTSGFMPRDVHALIADASANSISSLHNIEGRDSGDISSGPFKFNLDNTTQEPVLENLGGEDMTRALERSKKRNASALGAPKVPSVKWEDVGGLEDVKKSILDTVQLPLLHKDLFSSGLRKRSGVLLYGPPGTGKTLLAKAVATECSLNFLSVKGPELINMYIGESEKNVRDIFHKARSARPCVIFFDELDSLAPARGASGDSGGVMDRVVSQMLAEIDGLNDSVQDLFVIGASNRPDLIDPALLRPGRFDKLLYVGVNSDTSYRERVLAALTRKFKLHQNVSLYSIAKKCPLNVTGADMYALCADAWFHAAKRTVSSLPSGSSSVKDDTDSVTVELDDFIKAIREISPSLSMSELRKYEMLRDQFEGASK
ncbi:hypothetical protein Syun_012386 [Stephania yunnanensis]|uniref:Peroxisomal ATPase PEX6 n=1 Tax=Stephania yunnanensis TaxID=152371 RepID=A0AAP0JZB5_9MAGN